MTATAVVGSAAEDTTPSEREAPQRFAWWHPQSADLGRRAEARRQHARRNDLWARPMPRTVNGTGHTGPSEFCATSI